MAMKIHIDDNEALQEPLKEEVISKFEMQDAYTDLAEYLGTDEFPFHALPRNAQIIVEDIAENKRVSQDMVFMHLLALASACTGSDIKVCPNKEIHSSWQEPCTLWGMIVADSGESKTPTMKLIFRPLEIAQAEAEQKYNEEYAIYEESMRKWTDAEEHGDDEVPPIEPSKVQYYIDDTTMESIHAILMTNKKGLLWRKDEIRGLLKNLNKYNKGDSLDVLLSLYSGFPWTVNRSSKKGRGSQASDTVLDAQISIYGGIQPGVLEKFFSQDDIFSGLVQRFLFCFLDKTQKKTLKTTKIPQSTFDLIDTLTVDMLRSSSIKRTVYLTDDAFELFNDFYEVIANHQPRSFLMKSTNNCLRIALALYQLEANSYGQLALEMAEEIDARHMQNAIDITKWFLVTLFKNIMPLLNIQKSKSEAITQKNNSNKEFLANWISNNFAECLQPMTCKEILQKMPRNHPFKNSSGKPSIEILGKVLAQAGYKKIKDGNGQRTYILNDFENEEE